MAVLDSVEEILTDCVFVFMFHYICVSMPTYPPLFLNTYSMSVLLLIVWWCFVFFVVVVILGHIHVLLNV